MSEHYRDEIEGGWRRLLNEELYNLYYYPNIVRVTPRITRWTQHAACMGEDCIQGFDRKI
jgi:hypothetical protein